MKLLHCKKLFYFLFFCSKKIYNTTIPNLIKSNITVLLWSIIDVCHRKNNFAERFKILTDIDQI